jgi:hypothetical protein
MILESRSFKNGQEIPQHFTCDSDNISPQLSWSDVPEGTKSFVLIADDPDAPMGTWVHWVMYDIPGAQRELDENIPKVKQLANGAKQGENDFREIGYGGPCPPGGTHRYFFKLYALKAELNQLPGLTKDMVEKKLQKHLLDSCELMGTYSR